MDADPVDVALRHVVETQRLLDSLITSSETFDYPKAKVALRQLQKKTKELAKFQAQLAKRQAALPNIRVVDFSLGATAPNP